MLNVIDEQVINNLQLGLIKHPLFNAINSLDELRIFMSSHVYAVWDFMSLTKRLQQELTVTTVPWVPAKHRKCARFINEVVIGEECDLDQKKHPISHLELYLNAMNEIGANTQKFQLFLNKIIERSSLESAFDVAQTPEFVQEFVKYTIDISLNGSLSQVIGSFFYGRENLIPALFSSLLEKWGLNPQEAPSFYFYLIRHIELDGDEHGPAVKNIINTLLLDNSINLKELYEAAADSISKRIKLWDGIYDQLV